MPFSGKQTNKQTIPAEKQLQCTWAPENKVKSQKTGNLTPFSIIRRAHINKSAKGETYLRQFPSVPNTNNYTNKDHHKENAESYH